MSEHIQLQRPRRLPAAAASLIQPPCTQQGKSTAHLRILVCCIFILCLLLFTFRMLFGMQFETPGVCAPALDQLTAKARCA